MSNVEERFSLKKASEELDKIVKNIRIDDNKIVNSEEYKMMVNGKSYDNDHIEDHFEEWYKNRRVPSMTPGVAKKYMEFIEAKRGK